MKVAQKKKKRNSKSNLMFSIFPCTVFVFEYSSFAKHPHSLQYLLHLMARLVNQNHALIAFKLYTELNKVRFSCCRQNLDITKLSMQGGGALAVTQVAGILNKNLLISFIQVLGTDYTTTSTAVILQPYRFAMI